MQTLNVWKTLLRLAPLCAILLFFWISIDHAEASFPPDGGWRSAGQPASQPTSAPPPAPGVDNNGKNVWAHDDLAETGPGVPVTVDVLANDEGVDGDNYTLSVEKDPKHGQADYVSDGEYTYTPESGFSGQDDFHYELCVEEAGTDSLMTKNCDKAKVIVTVVGGEDDDGDDDDCDDDDEDCECEDEDDDDCDDDDEDCDEDDDEDCDDDGDDDGGDGDAGDVDAKDDDASTGQGMTVTIAVLANDEGVDPSDFSLTVTENPGHGSAAVQSGGSILYTPSSGFTGEDEFNYEVCSAGEDNCDQATVRVTVLAENETNFAPVAVDDSYSTPQDTPLTISAPGLLENDGDANDDNLTVALEDPPDHGDVTLNANGSLTYTPDPSFVGLDSFTYSASDGQAKSNLATVRIEVIDTQTPTVQWLGPVTEEEVLTVGYETVRLEVEAGDNGSIDRVQFVRWDAMLEEYIDIAYVYSPPYVYDLHTSQLNPEWNQIFVRVYDAAGNASESPHIWIYLTVDIHRVFLPTIVH